MAPISDFSWQKVYIKPYKAVLQNHTKVNADTSKRRFLAALEGFSSKQKPGPMSYLIELEQKLLDWILFFTMKYWTSSEDEVRGKVLF